MRTRRSLVSRLTRRAAVALALLVATGLVGCAMTGGEEGGSSAVPKNVDSVHMKNGDVLVGELAVSEIQIQTEYLSKFTIEPRHVDTLEMMGDGKVRLETRHGDVLNGSFGISNVRLRTKTGRDLVLPAAEISKVRFAE